jgi:hypothetical protein
LKGRAWHVATPVSASVFLEKSHGSEKEVSQDCATPLDQEQAPSGTSESCTYAAEGEGPPRCPQGECPGEGQVCRPEGRPEGEENSTEGSSFGAPQYQGRKAWSSVGDSRNGQERTRRNAQGRESCQQPGQRNSREG